MPHTPLLDTVKLPSDMKGFSREELKQLADEVRTEVIDAVSVTGGHLGAGLGVVEFLPSAPRANMTPLVPHIARPQSPQGQALPQRGI